MSHLAIFGPTRVGKSNFGVWRSLQHMRERTSFTFVLPHDPPAETLVAEIYARLKWGVVGRLIVEDAGDMNRVIPRQFVQFSTSTNVYEQERDDRLFEERAMEPCIANLAEGTELGPAKDKYSRLAIRLFQEARRNGAFIGESDIPDLLAPDHPSQRLALSVCKKDYLIREFDRINVLPLRDYFSHVESAIRFLETIYKSPVVKVRTQNPPSFDWPAFFRRGGIHIITKGKASEADFRALVNADFLMKYRMAMDGKMPKHFYKMDEVANYGLLDDFKAIALQTSGYREFWLEMYLHGRDFPTPEIERKVLNNCDKVFMRQSDPDMQEFAARELRALLDREKEHHRDFTTRMVHDGFDEIARRTRGKSKAGGRVTESESVSPQLIARYKEVVDERVSYESPNDQVFWQAQRIGELQKGELFYKPLYGTPSLIRVPLVQPSFFVHTIERKIYECLTLIRQNWPYETPKQTTTASPANVTSDGTSSSTFTPLPPASSSKPESTRQPRKRGKGSKGPKAST